MYYVFCEINWILSIILLWPFDFGVSNRNKTSNAIITWHWGTFVQSLLWWKRKKYYVLWVWICSLRYPACNAHAPHCYLWPARLYNIFAHYLINRMIFGGGELSNMKCVFWFPLQFVWNISHCKNNSARYYHKCTLVFM